MSLFSHPVRVRHIRILSLFRATYRGYVTYGRTSKEAIDRVRAKYEDNRFRLSDIPHAIGYVILSWIS